MNLSYWKVVFRSIKGSLVRYLAILAIIGLGVGFFSGLKVTMPSFMLTGDRYIKKYQLFDYRVLSTVGFTREDIEKIKDQDGIRAAEGSFFSDTLASRLKKGKTNKDDIVNVVRFHTLTSGVNELDIIEGRMPIKPNEIVIDAYACDSSYVGDKLVVDSEEGFLYEEYDIVGRVRSPYYLNFQKGTTEVGGGSVSFFVYVPEEGLDFEYYSELFVKLDSDLESYSDEYEENVDSYEKTFKPYVESVVIGRFDELRNDAEKEYEDGLTEYNNKISEAQKELDDAKKELDDAKKKLDDAKADIEDGEKKVEDGKKQVDEYDEKLDAARLELDANAQKISDAQDVFDAKKKELDEADQKLQEVRDNLPVLKDAKETLEASIKQMEVTRSDLSGQRELYLAAMEAGEPDYTKEGLDQIEGAIAAIDLQYPEVKAKLDEIDTNISLIESSLKEYSDGLEQYNASYSAFLEQKAQYESYVKEYNDGLDQFNDALKQLETGESLLEDAKKKYDDGLKEYEDGLKEYEDGKAEFEEEKETAWKELQDARDEIDKLEDPEIYVLKRDTNVGYVCFENDAKIVDGMAEVFPLFFFAIAALVCSTTMQRMVADERVQIGTMRALGYKRSAIVMKYVIYSGSASVIGCLGGFFGGTKLFPYVIWKVYDMMYGFAPITFKTDYLILTLSMIVSLLCSVGVTVITCFGEFTEEPAELVRPKAPQSGKRILLERIEPVWKRLRFLHKVSARNVFRFKKRMWMMIIGIAGCTALVITGFGLKDSIDNLINFQYDEIMTYDVSVNFDDDVSEKDMTELFEQANSSVGVDSNEVLINIVRLKHNSKTAIRDVELFVSSDESFTEYVRPHFEGKDYSLPSNGEVAISSKLASSNKLKAGDNITFEYGDEGKTVTVRIGYVFENYIYHYAIMNAATYKDVFGKTYEPNSALYKVPQDKSYEYGSFLGNSDKVKSWNVMAEGRRTFGETMKQLNYVVILVIGCAALLAFIVLFNLNNINITERVREIATLKVLGFNRRETGSYVFRENFILVFLGFLAGVPLGIILHSFVISQIKMDIVTYKVIILPLSYVYSILTVFLFSIIVDLVMRRKIDRIDMAESLKSIE